MAQVSVPGANGSPIVFTVTGTSATNMAVAFANTLNPLNSMHELQINVLSATDKPGPGSVTTEGKPVAILNDILAAGSYALSAGSQYTFVDTTPSAATASAAEVSATSGSVTVTGSSAGSDTVLAASSTTYLAVGSDNLVSFVSGDDVYQGSTVAGATGDTVTAGSGADTINTNSGDTTVFGGGNGVIVLNDTTTGGTAYNDVAFLGDGSNIVLANGANDLVFAAQKGQVIVGTGADSTSLLSVVIANPTDSNSSPSMDTIVAGSDTTNIYDSVGGAVIFAGSGTLNFIGESPLTSTMPGSPNTVSDTIVSSTGTTAIFATAGDNLTFSSNNTSSPILVSAGVGNETLNGANAMGGMYFFASQDTSSMAAVHDTIVGGSGANYFQTGVGNEVYDGGSGSNIFDVATTLGPNTHVTIYDFNSNDFVNFVGVNNVNDPSQATMTVGSINNNGTSEPTLTVTFADKSSVEFIGISSLPPGHIT